METDPSLPFVAPEMLSALVSPSGRQLDANEAWRSIFGSELWGRLPPEDARFAQEHTTEAVRGGEVLHQVYLVPTPGGEPIPVLLHFHPIREPDLEPGHFPVLITGEAMREPVSWAAEQTRRRRMEMLGRMSMGIAHDFNNLLTAVIGHSELLRSDLVQLRANADAHNHLRALERAARDGASLVRKIQGYIRDEKKERAEPVLLQEIADEVLTLTRPYWYNEPRRQGIAIRVDSDIRPVPPIMGTPTELREVLVNLVLNAVQAMPAGGTLTIKTARSGTSAAMIEVGDTGVGMTESVRRRIFEPLFTTKGQGGTGMGLTMSQGIVQEHNGRIEVDSAPGRGTLFRLVFPFSSDTPSPVAATPRAAPKDLEGLRILVVDDEMMVRTVTTKLLGLRGHTVEAVDGGPAALEVLAGDAAFDVVVTDLSMPDMSGRELAAAIRYRHEGLPVLLLTGDTDAESPDVAAVVKKPFELDDLDAEVRRVAAGMPAVERRGR